MKTIYKIYSILDYSERKTLHKLLGLVIVMAMLDTLGVISIMPFMALLSNPDFIFEYEITTKIYSYFQLDNYFDFLMIAGGSILLFFIISLIFKAYVSFLTIRFAMAKEYSISKRLFSNHLNQPYSWYLEKNTSELTKSILSEVATLISYGVAPFLNVIAYSFVSVALLALLIALAIFMVARNPLIFLAMYIPII